MQPKLVILGVAAITVALADRGSKLWIEGFVPAGQKHELIEGFFSLTHARNPGAAIGLFQELPWWVFAVATLLALFLIWRFYLAIEAGERLPAAALGLIVGGAIGNLIDRVGPHHSVLDFLHFDFGFFQFPDFNVADSAIVIGVALLLLDSAAGEAESATAVPPAVPPAAPPAADGEAAESDT